MAAKSKEITKEEIERLVKKAVVIRRHIVEMLAEAGSGHPGGSLSAADVMTALYFRVLRHKPDKPRWENRDRFVLSKGHAVPVLYAVLAESGYFPTDELKTLRKMGSILKGHPLYDPDRGVEATTGSLGQGLSVAVGMALGMKLDRKRNRVFAMVGDGECDEGQIWEAAMCAAHYKLDNLTAIIDRNHLQIDGTTEEVMALEPLPAKWKAFGWRVTEIDGHNMEEVVRALEKRAKSGSPSAIVAHTVKGKGVSFMENKVNFHGVAPTKEQCAQALKELGGWQ
ncbi:MAG: transketolase [bacterium]